MILIAADAKFDVRSERAAEYKGGVASSCPPGRDAASEDTHGE